MTVPGSPAPAHPLVEVLTSRDLAQDGSWGQVCGVCSVQRPFSVQALVFLS